MNRQWMTADSIEYELLKENARANRKNMTEAESAFWTLVKDNGFGQRCLRQHIIGGYIVDFLFRKSKVVVEIDGGYHRPKTPRPSKSPCSRELLGTGKQLTGDLLLDSVKQPTNWQNDPEQIEKDRIRQDWLEHQGYKVIRFTNEEILFDTDNVIQKVKVSLNREIERVCWLENQG